MLIQPTITARMAQVVLLVRDHLSKLLLEKPLRSLVLIENKYSSLQKYLDADFKESDTSIALRILKLSIKRILMS